VEPPDVAVPEFNLPDVEPLDVGSPDFIGPDPGRPEIVPPEIDPPEIVIPDVSIQPAGLPPATQTREVDEGQRINDANRTRDEGAPDSILPSGDAPDDAPTQWERVAPIRGSGGNTPPAYIIPAHPKMA
jgi:hypothetical protein